MKFLMIYTHGNETDLTRYRDTWDEWNEEEHISNDSALKYISTYNSRYDVHKCDHMITDCFQIGEKIYGN